MGTKSEVGERIKRARLEKGLTLKDIEARAGVSATHVSEIERGRTSPTVGALTKIANALGTEPAYLVEESAAAAHVVVRRGERRRVQLANPAVWLESLAGELPRSELSFLLVDWDRDVGSASLSLSAQGEEFAFVLEGCLEFVIDGERHVLREGDSIHFAASLPHSARKRGDGPCRALWATYPRLTL
jgi:transcriptional regulator with XRE-family HTH domain